MNQPPLSPGTYVPSPAAFLEPRRKDLLQNWYPDNQLPDLKSVISPVVNQSCTLLHSPLPLAMPLVSSFQTRAENWLLWGKQANSWADVCFYLGGRMGNSLGVGLLLPLWPVLRVMVTMGGDLSEMPRASAVLGWSCSLLLPEMPQTSQLPLQC